MPGNQASAAIQKADSFHANLVPFGRLQDDPADEMREDGQDEEGLVDSRHGCPFSTSIVMIVLSCARWVSASQGCQYSAARSARGWRAIEPGGPHGVWRSATALGHVILEFAHDNDGGETSRASGLSRGDRAGLEPCGPLVVCAEGTDPT